MSESFVYGLHAVTALVKSPRRRIKQLIINESRQDKRFQAIVDSALEANISILQLSLPKMHQRFGEINHQGVIALTTPLPTYSEADLKTLLAEQSKAPLILILDGLTDPHNLGACLRTAEAVAVDFVITPKDNSVGITSTVSKVASGAAELIPMLRATNLVRTMEALKQEGVWIYGAAAEAEKTIYNFDFQIPTALVFGAEGKGLRRLTREHCDELFSLPMRGSVESLNVSVATGVALYEVLRQRL